MVWKSESYYSQNGNHSGHTCTIISYLPKNRTAMRVSVSFDGVVALCIMVLNTVSSTILYTPYIWLTFPFLK